MVRFHSGDIGKYKKREHDRMFPKKMKTILNRPSVAGAVLETALSVR